MRIENPTLAHFRHFSSLFTNLPSTIVESSLQINPFYAKQTQFPKSQMNVSIFLQMAYENNSNWTIGQNKPNSNPNKANLKKAKMNANVFVTKDYRKKDDFAVKKNKANSNPISSKTKMNVNLYITKDYENISDWTLSENKANSKPIKACPERSRMGQFPKCQNKLKIACQKIWPHPKSSFIKVAIDFSVIKAIICGS